ncbi:MAG: YqgE/AlgH family protein [Myxococcaceae bacterium]
MERLSSGFLIAMPQLGDPNFHRSVVLILQHSVEGARGLVLNRPTRVTLEDVARGQSISVAPRLGRQLVYAGGPVDPQRGLVLHDRAGLVEKRQLAPGLFVSETVDALEELLAEGSGVLRFFLGYAGWGPQQLERELKQGTWLFTEASSERVLHGDADTLWEEVLRQMGVDPAMLQSPAMREHEPGAN